MFEVFPVFDGMGSDYVMVRVFVMQDLCLCYSPVCMMLSIGHPLHAVVGVSLDDMTV